MTNLSVNSKRDKGYQAFLQKCSQQQATLGELIALGTSYMRRAYLHHHFLGDYSLRANAQHLAKYALPDKTEISTLTSSEAQQVIVLFERRIEEKVPVAYLTNEAEYLGRTFYVNEHVLVPRSLMNTRFTDFLQQVPWSNYRVLDMCTGSGCIGITLALMEPKLHVDLADISPQAIKVAQKNIERFAVGERVTCIESNVFTDIQDKYDLIITNPPYVSRSEYHGSPAEFKNEPKIALEAGKDGLIIVHRLINEARNYLNPEGLLIAEIGFTAAKRVKKLYPKIPFTWFKYRRPNGKESWLGMHGVFLCKAKDLPT